MNINFAQKSFAIWHLLTVSPSMTILEAFASVIHTGPSLFLVVVSQLNKTVYKVWDM